MWLMGVVRRRQVESMGVVSECCCKEVYYKHPHNNYYFPLLHALVYIRSFFGSIILISLFIFKMFFRSCSCYFCAIL